MAFWFLWLGFMCMTIAYLFKCKAYFYKSREAVFLWQLVAMLEGRIEKLSQEAIDNRGL